MMKTIGVVGVIGVLLALVAPPVSAQPPMAKPGPEHERLKKLEGTWEATITTPAGESKGTMTYKMELGELWLVGDFKGEFAGQKFQGKGLDSYNPLKKKYVSVWVDSMSFAPMISEGAFDKEGKVLTQIGEGPGMDGKPTRFKSVTEMKDADTIRFTLSGPDQSGKEQTMLSILYKRRK